MEQVCGAMVAHSILAPLFEHIGLYAIADAQMSLGELSVVDDQAFQGTACVLYLEDAQGTADLAAIADLAAALGVEWRGVEDEPGLLWCADALDLFAIDDQGHDFAAIAQALVAGEVGGAIPFQDRIQGALVLGLDKSAGCAAALLLSLHGLLEAGGIDSNAMFGGDLLS